MKKAWNTTIHIWLKYNVYMRIVQLENKSLNRIASILTFLASAIWHGYYPNYYVTFMLYFLFEQIGLLFETKLDMFNYLEKKSMLLAIIFGYISLLLYVVLY